jgi:hypothetical protein
MMRAFWTWDPVSCTSYRAFDEPYAYRNNKWFFDKSVWQKMLRAMSGCGFDAVVLANTHPFPFMVDLEKFPEARVVDEAAFTEYQQMHHWIVETALDYDIAPYVLFFSIYMPDGLLKSRGIDPAAAAIPTDFSLEYTHYCVRRLLDEYPDIAGVFADASESMTEKREEFLQHAVVDALDAVRPDASLYLRGWGAEPEQLVSGVKRRGGRPIYYSVKYTYEHLVDPNPDPMFAKWVDAAGAENVAAEFWISNFEPWTSYSHETVDGILANLEEMNCRGFSLQPLSLYDWPKSSDTYFKYQFQRDLVWYSIWGGGGTGDLLRRGQPKWLVRNHRLLPGFEAGSRILELLALYFGGDKQNQWHPQFCSVRDSSGAHLFSIEDMLHVDESPEFCGRDWWQEVTGDQVVHVAEHVKSGTPRDAYGPDELIEELADLAEQAAGAGDKGMRSASGERELPSFARDAFCMGRLGEFYVERLRAALAHARGDDPEALDHMARAIGIFKEIRSVDSSHRGPFRVITGRCAIVGDWTGTVKALEAEYADASAGDFKRGSEYLVHKTEGTC